MTQQALEALEKSIEHWKRLSTGNRLPGEGIGPNNCALCGMFFEKSCRGCPVKEKTSKDSCMGTPYDQVSVIYSNRKSDFDVYKSEEFLAAAKRELSFLESLLPEEDLGI